MDKEQKNITNIYALLAVSLIMSFVPMMTAAVLAFAMFMAVLIGAYMFRKKAEAGSLTHDHMSYIIRTIWITGFFGIFSLAAAAIYVLQNYMPDALQPCAEAMLNAGENASYAIVADCMPEFISDNKMVFLNGTLIGAAPIVIYIGYRLAKGLNRAVKGHRIGDLKNWF